MVKRVQAFLVSKMASLPQITAVLFVAAVNLAASPAALAAAANCNTSGISGNVWGCVTTYLTPPYAWAQQPTVQAVVGMISIGLGLVAVALAIFFAWKTASLLINLFFHKDGAKNGAEKLKGDLIILAVAVGGGVLFASGVWFPLLIGIVQLLFEAVVSIMRGAGGNPQCIVPGQSTPQSC